MIPGTLVYLTPVDPANAETARGWINDPAVNRWMLSGHIPVSKDSELAWYADAERQWQAGSAYRFEVHDAGDSRLVGHISLEHVDMLHRHAEVGIVIGRPADWGKGYGADALRTLLRFGFETLGLHRIWITVFAENERAHALYKRVGFTECGRDREWGFLHGAYRDLVRLDMLEHEWDGSPS